MRARGVGGRRLFAAYRAAKRVSPRARRIARHAEVLAMASDLRRQLYVTQNQIHGAKGTGPDGLTPTQRRRIRHKENAGRGA
jgi:hypothetical protein